jgi:oleandomycin transport system ATP-binding protein
MTGPYQPCPGRASAVPAHPGSVGAMHTTLRSPAPGPSAFEVEDLVRVFGDVRAVDGISFTAQRGQVLGLLGPNGSGKTTTVRMLATLLSPTGGRASVLGHDVVADAAAVRDRIGLTGQYAAVDEALTGRDNLYLIGRLLDLSRRDARTRAGRLIEQFGLVEAAGRRVRTYSGGMRRRLDLAASLVGRPEVLFLDEPTTGLDPHHRNEVWEAVRALAQDGVTVLLTTQYLEEADQLAHDLVVLDHGRVIASGTAAELKSRTGGRRLHVRPEAPGEAALVAAIVASDVGAEPTVAPSGEVVVPTPDPGALRRVEDRLAVAGVAVAEIGLRLPSLDDVFLALTDHGAESGATAASPTPDPAPTDRGAA